MQLSKKLLPLKNLFHAAGLPGYMLFSRDILYFFIRRRRGLEEYASIDDSALLQIVFVFGIFIVSAFIIFKNPQKRKILFSTPQIFLLIYIFICFLSMLWTPNLMVTAFRAFESMSYLILISLVAYNLITKLSVPDVIEWAFLWILWELFWSIALMVKFVGLSYLIWPFNASRLSIPMFFFFALFLEKRNFIKYFILAFSILMISNKVYFGIAFGMIGLFFGDSKYKGWLLFLISAVLISLIFIDINELLKNTLFYGREAVSLANTSGRDKIWAISWEAFLKEPFLGYGYVDGENSVLYSKFSEAISTHSFLFSGLLGTGLLGTTFLLLYFWEVYRTTSSKYFPSKKWRPAMVSTFIMGMVISLTAPGIGGRVFGSWIPVVFVFTIISALEYRFRIEQTINKIQKITNNENHLGHP